MSTNGPQSFSAIEAGTATVRRNAVGGSDVVNYDSMVGYMPVPPGYITQGIGRLGNPKQEIAGGAFADFNIVSGVTYGAGNDITVNGDTIVIGSDGLYSVSFEAGFIIDSAVAGYIQVGILRNNFLMDYAERVENTTSTVIASCNFTTRKLSLSATDVIVVRFHNVTGGPVNIVASAASPAAVQVERVL